MDIQHDKVQKPNACKGDSVIADPRSRGDWYMENGLLVFTAAYHLKRGNCCKSGCRHCPYGYRKKV